MEKKPKCTSTTTGTLLCTASSSRHSIRVASSCRAPKRRGRGMRQLDAPVTSCCLLLSCSFPPRQAVSSQQCHCAGKLLLPWLVVSSPASRREPPKQEQPPVHGRGTEYKYKRPAPSLPLPVPSSCFLQPLCPFNVTYLSFSTLHSRLSTPVLISNHVRPQAS